MRKAQSCNVYSSTFYLLCRNCLRYLRNVSVISSCAIINETCISLTLKRSFRSPSLYLQPQVLPPLLYLDQLESPDFPLLAPPVEVLQHQIAGAIRLKLYK